MINITSLNILSKQHYNAAKAKSAKQNQSSQKSSKTSSVNKSPGNPSASSLPELFMSWVSGSSFTNPINDTGYSPLSSDDEEEEFRDIHHEYLNKKHKEFSKKINAGVKQKFEAHDANVVRVSNGKVNLGPIITKTRSSGVLPSTSS